MSGICIPQCVNTRTYWSSYQTRTRQDLFIYSFSFRKCFIVIYSHKYVYLLQIIIKYIENKKVRCVFQNN